MMCTLPEDGKPTVHIHCAAPNAALPEEPGIEWPAARWAACVGPEDDGVCIFLLAEGARAASIPSLWSPAGQVTSFPLWGPASPHRLHGAPPVAIPVSRVGAPDVLEQRLEDIQQRLNTLECVKRPGLPAEPPLRGVLRSPSLEEPALSLLPLASGGDFPGCLNALRSTLPEGSEAGEWHEDRAALSKACCADFVGRRRATGSLSTASHATVGGQRATPPPGRAAVTMPACKLSAESPRMGLLLG